MKRVTAYMDDNDVKEDFKTTLQSMAKIRNASIREGKNRYVDEYKHLAWRLHSDIVPLAKKYEVDLAVFETADKVSTENPVITESVKLLRDNYLSKDQIYHLFSAINHEHALPLANNKGHYEGEIQTKQDAQKLLVEGYTTVDALVKDITTLDKNDKKELITIAEHDPKYRNFHKKHPWLFNIGMSLLNEGLRNYVKESEVPEYGGKWANVVGFVDDLTLFTAAATGLIDVLHSYFQPASWFLLSIGIQIPLQFMVHGRLKSFGMKSGSPLMFPFKGKIIDYFQNRKETYGAKIHLHKEVPEYYEGIADFENDAVSNNISLVCTSFDDAYKKHCTEENFTCYTSNFYDEIIPRKDIYLVNKEHKAIVTSIGDDAHKPTQTVLNQFRNEQISPEIILASGENNLFTRVRLYKDNELTFDKEVCA